MVNTLASQLRGVVRKGQLVPVLLPRSVHQVCAILAAAKLDSVYVPLDVNIPERRLLGILLAAQPTLVITERRFQSLFKGFGSEFRFFDQHDGVTSKTWASSPDTDEDAPRSDDLAAVLFTSGSTGQPKGVMLSHQNLIDPVRLLSRPLVALGYLGDDAETERSFRASELFGLVLGIKGDVLHATGDWGILTDAGELILLGRQDSQIKINGQRIDLGEIHAVVDNFLTGSVIRQIRGPTGRLHLLAFLTQ
ncbi:hypothetical protein CEP52_014228 [Fusarium oligoseptatum]|uniref:AMP-dependent synthetase/ligase domain-containing protein n=1 Tax=Fusarium oligoseptatum TaxID=2604345 RepID=A0A428SNU1_9HYPO|nr:hypothetical protein CEP52_014228 [Fusarium oligoseptatum]